MKRTKTIFIMVIASAALLLSSAVMAVAPATPPARMQIVELDAAITSIALPLPGEPNTGPVSVSLCYDCTSPLGTLDCSQMSGLIYWPVEIDFPLLTSLGRGPIKTTFVGPHIVNPHGPENVYAIDVVDMAYLDDPDLGRVLAINLNDNKKIIPIVVVASLCRAAGTYNGTFEDMTRQKFDEIVAPWLRSAMDTALAELQVLNPATPPIPPAVLDEAFAIYESDPTIEIVLYFLDSGEFRTAHLTGTDTIRFIPRIPTVSEWGLIVMAGLVLTAGSAVIWWRRKTRLA